MKKALKITGIVLGSLILILAILPFAFEGKIYEVIQKKANENLKATVSFTDVDLSLLRNFPHLRVTVNDLKVVNHAPFENVTLANIKDFTVVINIKSLFTDNIEVTQILLDEPTMDVRVMADGTANYDITIPDSAKVEQPEEPSKPVHVALKKYAIEKGNIRYDDKSLAMVMDFKNLNHEGSGDLADAVTTLTTYTTADQTTFWFDGVTYANKAETEIKADLLMDMDKMRFEFKDNEIRLNQLYLQMNGWVNMPAEDIDMDLQFAATKTDFKNLLSMVPMEFAKDLDGVDASGKIELNGSVKGTYNDKSMPGIALNVGIENGRFKYPDLPKSVDDVQLKLSVKADMNNEDNSTVDMDKCHLSIGGNPIDMKLHLKTPDSDPFIDFMGKFNINLASLKDVIPIGKDEKLTGIIDADMMFKGHVSAAEKGKVADLQAQGKLDITEMDYESDSLPYDILLHKMNLTFDPEQALLNQMDIKVGNSEMKMKGVLTHYLEYAINDEKLVGSLDFYSPKINVNDFMTSTSDAPATATTTESATPDTASAVVILPNNIDFTLRSKIDNLLYDKATFTQVGGEIKIDHGTALFHDLGLNGLGGNVVLNGLYDGDEGHHPRVDMDFALNQVDIQTTIKTFATLGKWSSMAQSCNGKVTIKMNMKSMLDRQMMPINNSVDANGRLITQEIMVSNYAPIVKVAEKVNMDKWKKPVALKDINVGFVIKNGVIKFDPFTFKVDDIPVKMEGSATLEEKIDYTIETDIPFEKFPSGVVNQANSFLGQINQKLGTNLKTGNKINLIARITGDVKNPDVKVTSKALGEEAVQDLKDQAIAVVKEQVMEKVTELKNDALEKAQAEKERLVKEAQAQADKLKADAIAAADKAKADAYKEADKLASKGGNPLEKIANKKLAEEMRKKADQAYDKSIKEANAKADKLVSDASAKGDALIEKAK
jgi:hypothetical protein